MKNERKGFTITELVIVIVVIAILVGCWLFFSIKKRRLKSRRCTH